MKKIQLKNKLIVGISFIFIMRSIEALTSKEHQQRLKTGTGLEVLESYNELSKNPVNNSFIKTTFKNRSDINIPEAEKLIKVIGMDTPTFINKYKNSAAITAANPDLSQIAQIFEHLGDHKTADHIMHLEDQQKAVPAPKIPQNAKEEEKGEEFHTALENPVVVATEKVAPQPQYLPEVQKPEEQKPQKGGWFSNLFGGSKPVAAAVAPAAVSSPSKINLQPVTATTETVQAAPVAPQKLAPQPIAAVVKSQAAPLPEQVVMQPNAGAKPKAAPRPTSQPVQKKMTVEKELSPEENIFYGPMTQEEAKAYIPLTPEEVALIEAEIAAQNMPEPVVVQEPTPAIIEQQVGPQPEVVEIAESTPLSTSVMQAILDGTETDILLAEVTAKAEEIKEVLKEKEKLEQEKKSLAEDLLKKLQKEESKNVTKAVQNLQRGNSYPTAITARAGDDAFSRSLNKITGRPSTVPAATSARVPANYDRSAVSRLTGRAKNLLGGLIPDKVKEYVAGDSRLSRAVMGDKKILPPQQSFAKAMQNSTHIPLASQTVQKRMENVAKEKTRQASSAVQVSAGNGDLGFVGVALSADEPSQGSPDVLEAFAENARSQDNTSMSEESVSSAENEDSNSSEKPAASEPQVPNDVPQESPVEGKTSSKLDIGMPKLGSQFKIGSQLKKQTPEQKAQEAKETQEFIQRLEQEGVLADKKQAERLEQFLKSRQEGIQYNPHAGESIIGMGDEGVVSTSTRANDLQQSLKGLTGKPLGSQFKGNNQPVANPTHIPGTIKQQLGSLGTVLEDKKKTPLSGRSLQQ